MFMVFGKHLNFVEGALKYQMAKAYCECRGDYVAYGLFDAGAALDGHVKWVHTCGKPHRLYWERHIKVCPECLGGFSSPWEQICKDCACELGRDLLLYPYKSWRWARGQKHSPRTETTGSEQPSPADPQEPSNIDSKKSLDKFFGI